MTRHRAVRLVAAVGGAALVLTACGGPHTSAPEIDASDWGAVLAEADGQTVSWSTTGDDDLDSFVDDEVAPRLAELGVTLDRVDSADTVDAIWVGGEDLAAGIRGGRWSCGWADDLPHSRYLDPEDPAISADGCASIWQQTASALVYDGAELAAADVDTIGSLLSWARAHPGRFTYPAPPDRTGSMAVRSILYAQIDGPDKLPRAFDEAAFQNGTAPLWKLLDEIEPTLWRRGETYPTTQATVERLFAEGTISAYFTDRPGSVAPRVVDGSFPRSTRQAVPAGGNVGRTSHLAIPADAEHPAAALVLADVLQDPEVQLALHEATGALPGIDITRAPADVRRAFAALTPHPSALSVARLTASTQPELAGEYLARIDAGWRTEVLRR